MSWPSTTATCPKGSSLTTARLIGAAGLRWPVEEGFEFGKDLLRPGPVPGPPLHRDPRHTVLVMAALAVCAVTAAGLKDRTDTQAPPPKTPDQPPPADPGMIPLTIPEIKRLLAAADHTETTRPAAHWRTGDADTKPDPAGSTNAPAWPRTYTLLS